MLEVYDISRIYDHLVNVALLITAYFSDEINKATTMYQERRSTAQQPLTGRAAPIPYFPDTILIIAPPEVPGPRSGFQTVVFAINLLASPR
ncbi:hypothetical protein J6590_014335 [Homalodisca vitripennis]|nr:hypothetical protein J6590_014335 [Homalodisca vitripennis]